MERRFKVGDIIIPGPLSNHYNYTSLKNNAKLEVVDIGDSPMFQVKILSGNSMVDSSHRVSSEYFEDAHLEVGGFSFSDFVIYDRLVVVPL
ncbi:MAG TPA: hypothetical protein PKN48_01205 [Bacteroidales bacterium]|nr:hypothetical protein [Bacteroidales bacterium]